MTETAHSFTNDIRDALIIDRDILQLLGGAHVFDGVEADPLTPHINIAQTWLSDWDIGQDHTSERILTLQIWPQSGERKLAEALLKRTDHALRDATILDNGSRVVLVPQYCGSRRLPGSRDFHCVLRYQVIDHARRSQADLN